jgi:hypothetical protein
LCPQATWAFMQLGQLLIGVMALEKVRVAAGFFIGGGAMLFVAAVFAVVTRGFVYKRVQAAAEDVVGLEGEAETEALLAPGHADEAHEAPGRV